MTSFASVAIFIRDGRLTFKPPRKEPHSNITQARKSAARYWNGNIAAPDRLHKIVLVQATTMAAVISERATNNGRDRPWVMTTKQVAEAFDEPHLAACLHELGVQQDSAPPPMPDVLEINGVIYRREI